MCKLIGNTLVYEEPPVTKKFCECGEPLQNTHINTWLPIEWVQYGCYECKVRGYQRGELNSYGNGIYDFVLRGN